MQSRPGNRPFGRRALPPRKPFQPKGQFRRSNPVRAAEHEIEEEYEQEWNEEQDDGDDAFDVFEADHDDEGAEAPDEEAEETAWGANAAAMLEDGMAELEEFVSDPEVIQQVQGAFEGFAEALVTIQDSRKMVAAQKKDRQYGKDRPTTTTPKKLGLW